MALRISKRSWRRADSRARCCAHFTLEMATPARMPMMVTTTINSMRVNPCWRDLRVFMGASPFVVVGLAVERQRRRRRVHLERIVGRADAARLGVVLVGEHTPFLVAGHRVDEVALAEEADDLAVAELDRLGQRLEVLRPLALPDRRRLLDAVRRLHQAQVVVPVDGLGDPAQPLAQLDLLLPPDAERQHRDGHGGEDADDGHDGDQLGDGEAAVSHSTFARPPETVDATASPRMFLMWGSSITRNVSPVMPPRTRSAARSPPELKRSGCPSDEVTRINPCSPSIVTTGGFCGSIFMAGPNEMSATFIAIGS